MWKDTEYFRNKGGEWGVGRVVVPDPPSLHLLTPRPAQSCTAAPSSASCSSAWRSTTPRWCWWTAHSPTSASRTPCSCERRAPTSLCSHVPTSLYPYVPHILLSPSLQWTFVPTSPSSPRPRVTTSLCLYILYVLNVPMSLTSLCPCFTVSLYPCFSMSPRSSHLCVPMSL